MHCFVPGPTSIFLAVTCANFSDDLSRGGINRKKEHGGNADHVGAVKIHHVARE